MKDIFLVTGATGQVGSAVARELAMQGRNVRGLTRTAERVSVLPKRVLPAIGDLNKLETLPGLLQDITGLFLLPGFKNADKVLALAKNAGVQHVVVLSGGVAATNNKNNPIVASLIEVEEAVRAAGVPWTILRPGAFMTNTLSWAGQLKHGDIVRAAFPQLKQGLLDPEDIGKVAAAVMVDPIRHQGKTYDLSGQEQLSNADRVQIIGEVLKRPLVYQPYTIEEARAAMRKTMPEAFVSAFFDFHGNGDVYEPDLSSTVKELTGRAPKLFREWVEDNRQAFAKE